MKSSHETFLMMRKQCLWEKESTKQFRYHHHHNQKQYGPEFRI